MLRGWEPTPTCRIAIVRAAISPSQSAKRRLEKYFRRNSPSEWVEPFLGPVHLGRFLTRSSRMSVVISSASARERTHSSSSNIFVVGSFSFFKKMSCVLRSRHSSGISLLSGTCEGNDGNPGVLVAHPWALEHSWVPV